MVCISESCIEWNLGLTIVVEVLRLYPPVLVFFWVSINLLFMFYIYIAARSIAGMEIGS